MNQSALGPWVTGLSETGSKVGEPNQYRNFGRPTRGQIDALTENMGRELEKQA